MCGKYYQLIACNYYAFMHESGKRLEIFIQAECLCILAGHHA
jgi:GDP-D-mannose dehydratase